MNTMPPVTKNLLIINVLAFASTYVAGLYGIDLKDLLGLHFFLASDFRIYQIVTYMFMHANFQHIFFNMFALFMFGPALEEYWGSKRFLIYYLVCGLGAALVQEGVWAIKMMNLLDTYSATSVQLNYTNILTTIGASGSVFGLLLAFGWLFPDIRMFIMFIPIPIRARTLVTIYAIVELFEGLVPSQGDNIAHFAHLGGMLFGLILILWWNRDNYSFGKWFKNMGSKLMPEKKQETNDKDYSDYHYHRP